MEGVLQSGNRISKLMRSGDGDHVFMHVGQCSLHNKQPPKVRSFSLSWLSGLPGVHLTLAGLA